MPTDPDNTPSQPPPSSHPPGTNAGEFAERDLWSLDDPLGGTPVPVAPRNEALPNPVPTPRGTRPAETTPPATPPAAAPDAPRPGGPPSTTRAPAPRDVKPRGTPSRKPSLSKSSSGASLPSPVSESAFSDLDDVFEDADLPPREADVLTPPDEEPDPVSPIAGNTGAPGQEDLTITSPGAPTVERPNPAVAPVTAAATAAAPAGKPAREPLSKLEKISLGTIAALGIGIIVWSLGVFYSHIPTRGGAHQEIRFPVNGQLASIAAASSYWRAPVRDGPDADSVRTETRLIPVLKLRLASGNNGALRVFFRNEAGDPVGDSITRSFNNGSFTPQNQAEIEIPATAGFSDEGMHAAYRADETKPWHIEVFEGPDPKAPFQQFHKLLTLPISTNRR